VRNKNTDCETAKDEESCQAVENSVEGFGHDFSWVLGFTCGHGDVVWTGDGEGCLDETLQEA